MHVEMAFIAQAVQVHPGGQIDVTGLGMSGLAFDRFPATLNGFKVFALVRFSPTDLDPSYPVRVTIIAPGGATMPGGDLQVATGASYDARLVSINIDGLTIPGPGIYRIRFAAEEGEMQDAVMCVQDKNAVAQA